MLSSGFFGIIFFALASSLPKRRAIAGLIGCSTLGRDRWPLIASYLQLVLIN
jgi:hypothetical protein